MSAVGEPPPWDEERARAFLGKHVVIGLTYVSQDGELLGQLQVHGDVVEVDEGHGIAVELSDAGKVFWLPPDPSALKDAPPGEYRFRSTGEVVVDPDLMTSWTVTASPGEPTEGAWANLLRDGFAPPEDNG
jgi:hypothetical protein